MVAFMWLWVAPLLFGLLAATSSFLHYRHKGYPLYQGVLVGLLTLGVVGSAMQALCWVVWTMVAGNR